MATNVVLKLLQHSDFEMLKYGIFKIKRLIKLNEYDKLRRSANIFKVLSVCLSIRVTNRDKRLEYHKLVVSQLYEIKRDLSVEINLNSCDAFYDFINRLRALYDVYQLEIRQDAVKIMRHFMEEYVEFLSNHEEQRAAILKTNSFLNKLFVDLFTLATEAVEDIRLICVNTLMLIIDEFMPKSSVVKGDAYFADLKEFRKNVSKAFESAELTEKMELYCKLEKELVKHVYEDPALFMQGIVKLAIDETEGAIRDTLVEII